jgi:hypothetical protein
VTQLRLLSRQAGNDRQLVKRKSLEYNPTASPNSSGDSEKRTHSTTREEDPEGYPYFYLTFVIVQGPSA